MYFDCTNISFLYTIMSQYDTFSYQKLIMSQNWQMNMTLNAVDSNSDWFVCVHMGVEHLWQFTAKISTLALISTHVIVCAQCFVVYNSLLVTQSIQCADFDLWAHWLHLAT